MSFSLPQEDARRAYTQNSLSHPLYNQQGSGGPPPAHRPPPQQQQQQQQQPHVPSSAQQSPYYRQLTSQEERPQIISNGLNQNAVGASPPASAQMQQDNYMYHLQQAATAARQVPSSQQHPMLSNAQYQQQQQQQILGGGQVQPPSQQQQRQQILNGTQNQSIHPLLADPPQQQQQQLPPQQIPQQISQQIPQQISQQLHLPQQPQPQQLQQIQRPDASQSQPQPLAPRPSELEMNKAPQHQPQQQLSQQQLYNGQQQSTSSSSTSTSASPQTSAGFGAFPLTPDGNLRMDPPPEASFPTFEALLQSVNAWGLARGYACVIGRSKKKNKVGLKKVLLTCDKGGTSKHNMLPVDSPARRRATTSRKTGCQFSLYAIETTMEWLLKYRPDGQYNEHNHPPSKGAQDHPAARRLDRTAVAAVKALKDAGVSAQETLKQIQAAHPNAGYLPRDIYNARAAIAREVEKRASEPDGVDPDAPLGSIYKRRSTVNPEDKFRDECRAEVTRIKEELDRVREESRREIERLKRTLGERDKTIERFEMFIDICNGRVMAQRERLEAGDAAPAPAGPLLNNGLA